MTAAAIPALDLARVRAAFPALKRSHAGQPVAYFDGPGGTQVPQVVVDRMADYLLHHNANTHWVYPTSIETDAALVSARQALADFLGADASEIVFGANMTTLTFHLARALGRRWGAGDEIIVTELDHHANVAPWQALAKERGLTLRSVRFDPSSGELDWKSLEAAVTSRTRLLAIGAASNALGTINDVTRAARMAHAAGALCFVDAVAFAPHALVDVHAIDCDFLACSSYKFYGPHLGILYGRRALLEGLDVPKLLPAPDTAPERLETGTQNHEGIVGAHAAVEFIAALGEGSDRRLRLADAYTRLHRVEEEQITRLWHGLAAIPGVHLYGPPPGRPRTATLVFTVDCLTSEQVSRSLADAGLFVSNGDFYATTAVERLGYAEQGLVRVGCACYTSNEEVDRVIRGVAGLRR
ncbi:MAG: cysteine desulfurase-like protein [Gemmatimonadota bacterium]